MSYPTIILLRHGQTEWNLESRYQGQLDSPLTPKGKEEAKMNALTVAKHFNVDDASIKIFSSPLGRAKASTLILCETLGIDKDRVIFEENLKELHYGILEGKTKAECQMYYALEFAKREADKWSYRIEGGESYKMVFARLYSWLERIGNEKIVIVVAHEMINRALRGLYTDVDHSTMFALRQPNDVVIKLENGKESIVN